MSGDPRPVDGLQDQLDRIESTVEAARAEARQARVESQETNGRLRKVEDDLYGPEEKRRRENAPGLLAEFRKIRHMVFDVAGARDESAAVGKAMRWIIGLGVTMIGTMIAALALMAQIVGGG